MGTTTKAVPLPVYTATIMNPVISELDCIWRVVPVTTATPLRIVTSPEILTEHQQAIELAVPEHTSFSFRFR